MLPHTCPWWFIGSFDNPLRRLIHPPEQILAELVHDGQTVLDLGAGMGYFTIPLAHQVGEHGKVIAADLQPRMLAGLRRRAERADMLSRIQLHQAHPDRLDIVVALDFALAFWMLHEVRRPAALLGEVFNLLKPGACLLLVEPVLHVPSRNFTAEVQAALEQGYRSLPGPVVRVSRSILLCKEV